MPPCVDNNNRQKSDTDRVYLERHWRLDLTGLVCSPCRTRSGKANSIQQYRELNGNAFAGALMCLTALVSLARRLRLTRLWLRL